MIHIKVSLDIVRLVSIILFVTIFSLLPLFFFVFPFLCSTGFWPYLVLTEQFFRFHFLLSHSVLSIFNHFFVIDLEFAIHIYKLIKIYFQMT